MAVEELEVRATLRDELSRGLRNIRTELRGVTSGIGTGLSRAGTLGGSALSRLGSIGKSALYGLGRAAKYGALAAAGAIGVLTKKAVDAASDLGESINKTRVIFADSSKDVLAWSQSTATASGIARGQALEAAAGFGNIANASGVAEARAAKMSQSLVNLAGDIASFNNIDPAEALEKLRAGLVGEAEPLRTVGVLLSETRVAQEAYRMGLAKTGEDLTDAQKVQARYALILKDTAKTQGDFARTASTSLPNTMRIIKASMQDTLATMGQALLPVMLEGAKVVSEVLAPAIEELGPVLAKIVGALGRLLGPALELVTPLVELFGEIFAEVATALEPVIRALIGPLRAALTALKPAIGPIVEAFGAGLLAVVEALGPIIPVLAQAFADLAIALAPAIEALGQGLADAIEAVAPFLPDLTEAFVDIVKALVPIIPPLTRIAVKLLALITPTVVKFFTEALAPAIETVAGWIENLVDALDRALELYDLLPGGSSRAGRAIAESGVLDPYINDADKVDPDQIGANAGSSPSVRPPTRRGGTAPRAVASPTLPSSTQGGGITLNAPLIGQVNATSDVDVERAAIRVYRRLRRDAEERG